jgi:hypothetical protein
MTDQTAERLMTSDHGSRLRDQPLEWRCFHCDEVFTDKAEAREHFGDYIDDSPLCLIKGEDGGLAKRVRELEAEVAQTLNERNEYENDARLWHESEADRVRRIGHCQWWQEMDSREGEKLVLQERVKELEAALLRASASALSPEPKEVAVGEAEATLASARLAVNDWVPCSTSEELERWRAAQRRLIDAAKRVGKIQASKEIEQLKKDLRSIE